MSKIFLIGWKDLKVIFRDRAALIFMLAAPLALTIGLGLVSGSFTKSNGSLSGIPVILVNQDQQMVGDELVSLFQSDDLNTLISASVGTSVDDARRLVDEDQTAAAVIIPAGFTDSVIPSAESGQTGPLVQIELYANPARPTSAGVVKSILDQFIQQVEVGRIGAETAVSELIARGWIDPSQAASLGSQIGSSLAADSDSSRITVHQTAGTDKPVEFNALSYMAPGMALMFLMYTVSNGGRMLLYEKKHGTLSRLMVSPSTSAQVLGGKLFGVFLGGVVQMLLLIVACGLLFGLNWGNPAGVLLLVIASVIGATGWGSLVTAISKTPGQVSTIGSAIMLTFGILGGSFFNLDYLPKWFQTVSRITPNAWGISGFTTLATGGSIAIILLPIGALLLMGCLLFSLSAFLLHRKGLF